MASSHDDSGTARATSSVFPRKDGGQVIVLKVGTSSLYNADKQQLNIGALSRIAEVVKDLSEMGHQAIVVSSGAVGVGCHRLGFTQRPKDLAQKQALAAVGQVHLMKYYEDMFNAVGLKCAQVLITLDNLADRGQYLNVRNTFTQLLSFGVVPVVNENDTVAVQELRFGDNDTLSAQVAALVHADWLFLLTDVDHLYTSNPKHDPDARPILEVADMAKLQADTSTQGTQWGTGGMATKLTAARIAVAAGTTMVICNSEKLEAVGDYVRGGCSAGTKFLPIQQRARGRKRWILSVPVKGQLWLDDGAVRAVKDRHASLFCPGIIKVLGMFGSQDGVQLCDANGMEFARGLSNFSSVDLMKIIKEKLWSGDKGCRVSEGLGYGSMDEALHRDNITLLAGAPDEGTAGDS